MAGRRRGTAGTFASTTIPNDPQQVCGTLHSPLASPCNAQVATPLSIDICCVGLGLEIAYTHGMEPRFQALSGREFKQGMDNYMVSSREPSEQELVGTMAIDIALAKYCPAADASSTEVKANNRACECTLVLLRLACTPNRMQSCVPPQTFLVATA